jgi:hypothetical protein
MDDERPRITVEENGPYAVSEAFHCRRARRSSTTTTRRLPPSWLLDETLDPGET